MNTSLSGVISWTLICFPGIPKMFFIIDDYIQKNYEKNFLCLI
ncbi:hypothetical protein LEP1GSC049_0748 [Leptospira kirschneri serovar Cynopteri str. 3522 CT]|uniref:Uncharacterized protein n=2 Tax=Leptospira noguchii TaxID=28182 RepID=T0FE43_9LEPT|nr:hypothetical protein LEP1GSC044_1320 [Leptospira kirschneri serovar Grippotyphosa str. RM52]EKP04831.1 hypothetical protein LEP1GSC018_3636 [Leptospira kirschneri str. 2008720114]EKQ83641.1 hypothetical protein LEP1GSC064_0997 [Leptospira kirschneri serovar Grippotyphosa str. Moskva]EKR08826.1 hypothetical protein LEP1GSC122_1318 [Leptospira kirschneri serovar Valbuzzi str. 200702274]EMK07994.1 hypothetical protein LEP1GSC176_2664 [Leptospira kirschneri str. MMD1493]EMK18618.1 hypothetical 